MDSDIYRKHSSEAMREKSMANHPSNFNPTSDFHSYDDDDVDDYETVDYYLDDSDDDAVYERAHNMCADYNNKAHSGMTGSRGRYPDYEDYVLNEKEVRVISGLAESQNAEIVSVGKYQGIPYYSTKNSSFGSINGYCLVPSDSPIVTDGNIDSLDVHGGVTLNSPVEDTEYQRVGFDTLHHGDRSIFNENGYEWDKFSVDNEMKKMMNQVSNYGKNVTELGSCFETPSDIHAEWGEKLRRCQHSYKQASQQRHDFTDNIHPGFSFLNNTGIEDSSRHMADMFMLENMLERYEKKTGDIDSDFSSQLMKERNSDIVNLITSGEPARDIVGYGRRSGEGILPFN